MSAELIGILSVGVALAALHLASIRGQRQEIRRLDARLDALEQRMEGLESAMTSQFTDVGLVLSKLAKQINPEDSGEVFRS